MTDQLERNERRDAYRRLLQGEYPRADIVADIDILNQVSFIAAVDGGRKAVRVSDEAIDRYGFEEIGRVAHDILTILRQDGRRTALVRAGPDQLRVAEEAPLATSDG